MTDTPIADVLDRAAKDGFVRGYLIAVANIMHLHGEDTVAADVLSELGVKAAHVKKLGLTSYDTSALRPLFKHLRAREMHPARPRQAASLAREQGK